MTTSHLPVLCREAVASLNVQENGVYVDGTFGAGGYAREILSQNNSCKVIAIDRDPEAIARSRSLKNEFKERFSIHQLCFGDIPSALQAENIDGVDGMVFDLGVSSPQIDDAGRGFSFKQNGPLDMRMGSSDLTAADVVNTYDEKDIADILFTYGEERRSRAIAKAIVKQRQEKHFETTGELASVIRSVLGKGGQKIDPATRTFQGLRIYINRELEELETALKNSLELLKKYGRISIVTFHSLEDRIVKKFFKKNSGNSPKGSRYLPDVTPEPAFLKLIHTKPITPTDSEITLNPRARSAKLRTAERLPEKIIGDLT